MTDQQIPPELYPAVAMGVYQACSNYDQYLPEATEPVMRAWAKVFHRYQLTAEDLTAAVDKLYAENGSGWRPLPADIAQAARAIRQERNQSGTPMSHEDGQLVPAISPKPTDEERERSARARVDAILELARQKQLDAADGSAGSDVFVGYNPLSVSCDHCSVPAGSHCVVPGSDQRLTKRRYHPSREDKARAEAGAA